MELSQGQMLGGTGALNYMVFSRGNPKNFEEWYWITKDPNWKWKNVLPYFIKSEAIYDSAIMNSSHKYFFGSKGYIGVTRDKKPYTTEYLKGFQQVGKDLIDDIDGNRIGYSRGLVTVYDEMRQDAGSQYLQRITDSPYLAVAKGTLATRIIFDEHRNAVAVEVITDKDEKIVINARQEIIISAGAIKSPQLLMLSGLGPRRDLEKLNISCICDIPVGKNLQDHIAAFIPHKTNKKIRRRNRVGPGEFPTGLFVGYGALNESQAHAKYPDYQAIGLIMDNMQFMLQFCASTFNFPNAICNKLYHEANGNQVLITLLSNLYAHSRGQVQLRSANPKDPPKVYTGSFSYDRDLNDFIHYICHYLEVEDSEAFKSLGARMVDLTAPRCNSFEKGSREYWRCYALCMMVSLGHYSGTCAMGSVVDSRLRVRGVNRLRVADASIMPSHVTGNIVSAVVMIGEKAADIIKEDAGPYNFVEHEKICMDQFKNMP